MSLMIEHISILQAIYSSLTCYNIDLFNKIHISNVSITNMFFSPPNWARFPFLPQSWARFPFFAQSWARFLFFRRAGRVFLFFRRAGRVFLFFPIHFIVQSSLTTNFVIFFSRSKKIWTGSFAEYSLIEDDLIVMGKNHRGYTYMLYINKEITE